MKTIQGLKIDDFVCTEIIENIDNLCSQPLLKRLLFALNPRKYRYLCSKNEVRVVSSVEEVKPGVYNVHITNPNISITNGNILVL